MSFAFRARPSSIQGLALAALLTAVPVQAQVAGHRLPPGPEHPVRERSIDVQAISLDLEVDLKEQRVVGHVDIGFRPLAAGLREVHLDAAGLDVSRVVLTRAPEGDAPVPFETRPRELVVRLPEPLGPDASAHIRVEYATRPSSGLYFFGASRRGGPQAWNYGEGGRHYGWLPLYNDTNDRFTVESRLTVDRPYVGLANGRLLETVDRPDGRRTFHWRLDEPIPNYLLAFDVGELERVPLGEADSGGRKVPVGAWGPPETRAKLAHTFRNSPRMVEFFTGAFGRPYAWPVYDQIVLRDFEGAMETTGLVGFTETYIRGPEDPPDSDPQLDLAYPTWDTEDTIAHELAHHWFGDLVTCRSLGSLWLNESFASFAHTLWTAHDRGEDDLTYQRFRYLDAYLDYVHQTGIVRPLEYRGYESPDDMYQMETTYLKGALVLHMLRRVVGETAFHRALAAYLERHAFGAVEATDLLDAIRDTTGRNVDWFFSDWILGGGGHPVFEVSWSWSGERRQVDLTVSQVQADLPFENAFRLPLEVEVVTNSGRTVHAIEVDGWETRVSLPAPEAPVTVTFDRGGWAVAEVRYPRALPELRAQLDGGGLAEKLRAARQLATDFPRHPEAVAALAAVLANPATHWGLRQEAARDLGSMGGGAATKALAASTGDPDRRVRRAVAVALAEARGPEAVAALRAMVARDGAEDVVAAAAAGLPRAGDPDAGPLLTSLLDRDSRWWNVVRLGALIGLAERADPSSVPAFRRFLGVDYERPVRVAAVVGWVRAAPDDHELAPRLRELAREGNLKVREAALDGLGRLHRAEDREFLEAYARDEPDLDLAQVARRALGEIAAFAGR